MRLKVGTIVLRTHLAPRAATGIPTDYMSHARLVAAAMKFPFFTHRTMKQVDETERLRDRACIKSRHFSKTAMLRLEILTELERANNPPPDTTNPDSAE
jgi:hypothetical protein